MYIEWTSHLKDPKEKQQFIQQIYNSRDVLERLAQIASNKEKVLDRSETNIAVYDTPNWSERQAHKNGNREVLSFFQTLLNLDQQKENNDPL